MLYGLVDKYVVTDIPIDVWIDMSRECFPYTHVPRSRIAVGKNLSELTEYLKKMGLKHYREMIQSKGLTKVLFELDFSGFNDFLEFAFDEYFNKI